MNRQKVNFVLFTVILVASLGADVLSQQNINILVLQDADNEAAANGVDSAIRFLAQNPGQGVVVKKRYDVLIETDEDVEQIVNATCNAVDEAIDAAEPPHLVLDLTRTGLKSETSKSVSRAMRLPTLTASYGQEGDHREWRGLSESEQQYLVHVMPPADIVTQSIRDLVSTQNNTNAAIIFDESFVMDHKYKSLLQNIACRHIIVMVQKSSEDALRKQIKKLMDADIVNYFVLGGSDTIRNVMEAATKNMMFNKKFSWYAISMDNEDFGCPCDNATVVYMQPHLDSEIKSRLNMLEGSYGLTAEPKVESAFYFDLAMRGIKAIGAMAKDGSFVNYELLKCSEFDGENSPQRDGFDFRSRLKEASHTETWTPIHWGGNGKSYPEIALEMTRTTVLRGKVLRSQELGKWAAGMPGDLMFVSGQDLKKHQAVTVYKVAIVEQAPFIVKKMVDGKVKYEGYCIDLMDDIVEILGFEYELYAVPDGKFGRMDEEGRWNGMVKEIVDKRADIGLGPFSVMAERENVMDFTVPYYDLVGITILMKKPKVPTSLFKFLTVLEPEVWSCILFAYLFTSFLLWAFDKFSPYSYQNNREKFIDDDEKREFTLKECLWFCMTSLTPQGGGEAPKNLSGRLVAATWWLFGFIIIASYTANLAAFLTVSRLDVPIESLSDLSVQYRVQYAPINGSQSATYFERMTYIESRFYEIWKDMSLDDSMSPVERAKLAVWDYPVGDKYTKMWQNMRESGLPQNLEEAVARVRASVSSSQGFAFIGDATDIRYQLLISCDLQIIGDEFSRKPYALGVQQGSPLKEELNDAILKLLNQRKLESLKEKWWNQNPAKKICIKESDQSDGISIENIGGVFIVIFVGILLACFTLVFEYWWYKWRHSRRVRDSDRRVDVKEFEKDKTFAQEKSNFKTEYKRDDYDVAPTANPW